MCRYILHKASNLYTMKILLTIGFIITLSVAGVSQSIEKANIENRAQDTIYSYAYILVEGRVFSKKLKVEVDFGDTPEQIKTGKEYSERLTNKKSYAAILNYMVEQQFELVETLEYAENVMGSGGTTGIVFIMRRK
ncbi:hypothetical protein SAMN04488505_11132 [Chitinophaga rupis]|uniref:Uncharacterized protein n=2 Tax=Chitinophaga rupis TaxID=573321 RepID=A0A1H8HCF2_9BACT|nr:hypothetical protein SAMN04488505_11132 [Chitinophaga rupis]